MFGHVHCLLRAPSGHGFGPMSGVSRPLDRGNDAHGYGLATYSSDRVIPP